MKDSKGVIDYIKENVTILDIAQRHGCQIKQSNNNFAYSVCPFCADAANTGKNQYKLQFYLYSNSWSCHKCKRGGTVFDFVMEVTPCDFSQALETLCRIAGIDLSPKDKEFYGENKDVWAIPSIYRYLLNGCRNPELKYAYRGTEYTPDQMAKIYLKRRGITNEKLIEKHELVYVNLRKETIFLMFESANFSENAIHLSGVLKIPDFFYQDSILMPMKAFQKIRQFISLSTGMLRERRNPKAMNMLNVDGIYAPRRVWNIDSLYAENIEGVFITESVTDALCLQQEYADKRSPYPAVALGSQYISDPQRDELRKVPHLKHFILFDNPAGEDKNLVGEQLAESFGKTGFNVQLPLKKSDAEQAPKDINDLYLLPKTSESIKVAYRGLTFCEMIAKSVREAIDKVITPAVDVEISQLLFAEFMNQRVRLKCLPFSDVISTHSVPISVRASCGGIHLCDHKGKGKCVLAKMKKGRVIDIELDNPKIITFCHTRKESDIINFWKKELKLPCKGSYIDIVNEKTASVHQIELGPNIDYLTGFEQQSRFVIIRSYIVIAESEDLPKMQPMEVEGRIVAHPVDNHEIILLGTKVTRLPDAIEEFVVTDEVKDSLAKFQAMSLDEIMDDLVHHTGHVDTKWMHMAFVLTFHSMLHYRFMGADYLGCLHTLLLTDSGTGKTVLGKRLIELFRLGEQLICETSGRTGVTYSLVQTSGRWVVRWGAMPRNDRGFLMLDEFQAFPVGESQHIKEAMTSGQLKVNRAAQDFTYTRNRLVIAANPKPRYKGASTQLFSFDFPIEAIRTLFDTEAEIRRLNLAVLARTVDFSTELLHSEKTKITPADAKLTVEDWRYSVRWAWKRTADDIEIDDEAIKYLLTDASPRLVDKFKFAEDIPLFTASYTKHSLLKLSLALAALLKSTDENYEKVIVKKEHVRTVAEWLDEMYSSTGVRLDLYAAKRRQEIYMTDDDFDGVLLEMAEGPLNKQVHSIAAYMSMWTNQESWSTGMLKEAVEIDQRLLKKYNRICINNMLLVKRSTVLNKTPKMAEFIKRFYDRIESDITLGLSSEDLISPPIDIIELD